ncbi:MAG: IS3 family transposase [Candidatus Bipolaricaulis sp.]|nr:IS3 family transposase [Candidatus Bipolaricaulis sp.]
MSRRMYSERGGCVLVGIARSSFRYTPRPRDGETVFVEEIRRLATEHPVYGYRRIAAVLRREGSSVNVKRVHRIWKAEGLQVPRRRPGKRRRGPPGEVIRKAEHPNHVWTYDFIEDRTERGGGSSGC